MKTSNFKNSMIALAIGLVTVSCGSGSKQQSGTDQTAQQQAAPATDGSKIDLSKFTAVEIPKWDIVEDWMVPEFGVVTKASEMLKDRMYSLTIVGVTKKNVESYRQILIDNGMTKISNFSYTKDAVQVNIGIAGVETTKDSEMTITIQKK